ncbi:MAG TPA: hypothetical protein VGH28_00895 [Polyangiaceae bacterium]|jgi:hypothetical protein
MRWIFAFVPFVLAASCGGVLAPSSDAGAGADVTTSCAVDSDCPDGQQCAFPISEGCAAKKTCLAAPDPGTCKGAPYCACDGTNQNVCGPGALAPVASPGLCPEDAGPSCGLACELCDVSGFTPTPQSPPIIAANACPASDLNAFVVSCLGANATQASCTAWQQAEQTSLPTCGSCLLTVDTSAAWGPFVCTTSSCALNVGGCVDAALGQVSNEKGSGGAGSCGDRYTDSNGCLDFACSACGANDETSCTNDASQNACKSYVDATTNGPCASLDAGSTACFPQDDAGYFSFVATFCGVP